MTDDNNQPDKFKTLALAAHISDFRAMGADGKRDYLLFSVMVGNEKYFAKVSGESLRVEIVERDETQSSNKKKPYE